MPVAAWLLLQLLALPLVPGAPSTLPDADTDAAQIILSRPHKQPPPNAQQRRKLQGRFLHITDFHPDELYQPHSSTEEGIACHRKKGHAGAYGAEKTDCDSPLSLVDATFDWIRENIKDDIDFIIWTGDSARHDSDEKNPRDSNEVVRTNTIIADKFVDAIANQNGRLDVPVIPTFGNNDFLPHNIFYPGPNKWLHKYTQVWHRFIPEAQRHSFEFGGWFYVEVIPNELAVFSLNTMYFFDRNAGVDGCASPSEPGFRHMEWLRIQLQQMRDRGMKAIFTGHVPPARTEGKRLWDETCWQRYTLWLRQYRDVVAGSVFGHMNIDHFLLQDTEEIDIEARDNTMRMDEKGERVGVSSKGDYLQELRNVWSNLPSAAIRAMTLNDVEGEEIFEGEDSEEDEEDVESSTMGKKKNRKNRKKKYKKIGGKYAERYHLSLVSPSVVPNYFPTLRVVEYNISGLEDTNTWVDPFSVKAEDIEHSVDELEVGESLGFEGGEEDVDDVEATRGKKKKGKKGKKGKKKPKKPQDPNLIIPDDPPKSSLPGPAYLMQPFTFTGYTQYFANLTHINNDFEEEASMGELGWRDGDHDEKKRKKPDEKPKPKKFKYEIEYSTFDDGVYKLKDLTVKSFVKLAYRIGKRRGGVRGTDGEGFDGDFGVGEEEEEIEDDDFKGDEEDDDFEEDEEDDASGMDAGEDDMEVDIAGKKGKKGKKGKGKKKQNKVWLHFLDNAFVKTVSKKERKKM